MLRAWAWNSTEFEGSCSTQRERRSYPLVNEGAGSAGPCADFGWHRLPVSEEAAQLLGLEKERLALASHTLAPFESTLKLASGVEVCVTCRGRAPTCRPLAQRQQQTFRRLMGDSSALRHEHNNGHAGGKRAGGQCGGVPRRRQSDCRVRVAQSGGDAAVRCALGAQGCEVRAALRQEQHAQEKVNVKRN
jgi:hypothetical protein